MSRVAALAGTLGAILAPRGNFRALRDGAATLWCHRSLCLELARRDLGGQFAGQALGRLWIIAHPLLLYGVYVFIFAIVLKVNITQSADMPRDYTTYILAGLVPWLASQQALARAPTALMAHANLVKQVVFPIEVLPVGVIVAAAIPLLVGLAVIVARVVLVTADIPWTYVLLPAVVTIHAAFMLGLTNILAVTTPFFRDVKDFMQVMTVVGVYAIPAFYLPQWVPQAIRPWLYVNPFSYFVWMYQDALYFGAIQHPYAWLVSLFLAVGTLALGMRCLHKLKPYVANVL